MASILIRNLDDAVARRLRLQARLKGVPIEQEARRIQRAVEVKDERLEAIDKDDEIQVLQSKLRKLEDQLSKESTKTRS